MVIIFVIVIIVIVIIAIIVIIVIIILLPLFVYASLSVNTDIDECASSNGGCQSLCTNSPGSFACSCASGYQPSSVDVTICVGRFSLYINFNCTEIYFHTILISIAKALRLMD